jgi:hypothetical protein
MIDGGQWAHLMVLLFAKTSLPCLGAHCPFNPLFQLAESKAELTPGNGSGGPVDIIHDLVYFS